MNTFKELYQKIKVFALKNYAYIIWGFFSSYIIIFMLFYITAPPDENKDATIAVLSDSLTIYKDKYNNTVTENAALVLDNQSFIEELSKVNSRVKSLNNALTLAKDENIKIRAALVVANKTIISYKDSVKNNIDTLIVVNDTAYPVYSREINMFGKWVKGNVIIGRNVFDLNQEVYNEYSATLGYKRKWFRKDEPVLSVVNLNPYTKNTQQIGLITNDKRIPPLTYVGIGAAASSLLWLLIVL